jgi:hypothetical protein
MKSEGFAFVGFSVGMRENGERRSGQASRVRFPGLFFYGRVVALTTVVAAAALFPTPARAQSTAWAANTNLTGADTVSLSDGNAQFTITAHEVLTIQGTSGYSPTNRLEWQFEVCQKAHDHHSLRFLAGSGISAIQWSGGLQPGYTTTAGNGDFYDCDYNGTNLYCWKTISNVPC